MGCYRLLADGNRFGRSPKCNLLWVCSEVPIVSGGFDAALMVQAASLAQLVRRMAQIPPSIIGTAAPVLAERYTHSELNSLFMANGFPGDPPEGNKEKKCLDWLRCGNHRLADPLAAFGRLIAEFMDTEQSVPYAGSWSAPCEEKPDPRQFLASALERENLSYQRGGMILGAHLSGPSRSLAERLRSEGIKAVEDEYQRAYAAIGSDSRAALTAACAILESVCRTYLESAGIEPPKMPGLQAVWPETARHLGLNPAAAADDDIKRILQGLYSLADGIAALRTHEGSAHGKGDIEQRRYNIEPRHARLAVHAAHTMALFVMETWSATPRRN